ncbi:MAG: sulfatase, partial [Verrucomicrobiales bacterium]|nr:sulfatase [Verrucomicrobiales bacterium]
MKTLSPRLLAIFALTALVSLTCNLQAETKRPNILWLVGENMKLDLGCYGAENVRTPNLDGLAAKGERYTHVFSTS